MSRQPSECAGWSARAALSFSVHAVHAACREHVRILVSSYYSNGHVAFGGSSHAMHYATGALENLPGIYPGKAGGFSPVSRSKRLGTHRLRDAFWKAATLSVTWPAAVTAVAPTGADDIPDANGIHHAASERQQQSAQLNVASTSVAL